MASQEPPNDWQSSASTQITDRRPVVLVVDAADLRDLWSRSLKAFGCHTFTGYLLNNPGPTG
jgi:hypothetical protein